MSIDNNRVLIIDFGSQYTQLIARRVRESGVYSEIVPPNIAINRIKESKPKGIILSGGPASVYEADAPTLSKDIFNLGIPILGICYGMQLMAHMLGGKVAKAPRREYGKADLIVDDNQDLFKGTGSGRTVWMSHGDRVERIPAGFHKIAHTENSPVAAMRDKKRQLYAIQFHPEVVHTKKGIDIVQNFLYHISNCLPTWTMHTFMEDSIDEIKRITAGEKVISALSGGVDSSVAATLVHRAIGNRLKCVFVNNGLLRKDEADVVVNLFKNKLKLPVKCMDAAGIFLRKLKGVIDPEKKRRIIGREFIRIFEKEAKKNGGMRFLLQGTLYPDFIESISFKGPSATIKTHHNVGGLPKRMKLRLIEPLKMLFKDEVRDLGRELGVPDDILHRQPFPGPGLAIRIIGEVTRRRLDILREADAIVREEIERSGPSREIWQSFAILIPIKTVGVMGDERTYEQVIAIRAVTSLDGMTADWARLPDPLLERMSNRIINEVKGINRVVYDISSKPPSTIEWE